MCIGGCLGSLACCVTSSACGLCCKACPSCKNSTSSRIVYAGFLLLGVIISCILLIPSLQTSLEKVPGLCSGAIGNFSFININGITKGMMKCDLIVGYRAVYAVCFGMVCFFGFMALLMICVKSSKDPRAGIQNGFWLFKMIAFIGPMVGGFFLPWDKMATAWMVIGMLGGFLFILIQLVLIIDFAYAWNGKFIDKYEEHEHKGWFYALLAFTILFFAITLTGLGLMFHFYGKSDNLADLDGCHRHHAFLGVNLVLIIAVTVISILPKVQEANPQSGLLQPSIVALYVMYLTWSAITNDNECNPSLTQIFTTISGKNVTSNSTGGWGQQIDAVSIVSLLFWLVAVIYASIRNSSHSSVGKLTMRESDTQVILQDVDEEKNDDKDESKTHDNEKNGVAYNYSVLHLMFMLASFYIMMTLTNWYKPSVDHEGAVITLTTSVPSMWVKISSSWVCLLIYLWTLIAPLVLTNREF